MSVQSVAVKPTSLLGITYLACECFIVVLVGVGRHQVVGGGRPAVGIHIASLRLGEVGRCEAFDGVADVLLGEDGQRQEEEDEERVFPVQLVDAVVDRNMDSAN